MTLDKVLLEIENYGFNNLVKIIPGKEIKILKSLAGILHTNLFFTENQGRLLHRIFEDHKDGLSRVNSDLITNLKTPEWSRSFRILEQVKKLYLGKDTSDESTIIIEFSYNGQIRKIVNELHNTIPDSRCIAHQKTWSVPLTEKNTVTVIDALKSFNFEISEILQNHYNTIKSWNFDEVKDRFFIEDMSENNLIRELADEIGEIQDIDYDVISDRRLRFNYFTKTRKNSENSLKNLIINRSSSHLWIDSSQFSLEDVIAELLNLNRAPMLFVLEGSIQKTAIDGLRKLEKSLKNLGITNDVGIHFRLDSTNGKEFNAIISENQYNAKLTQSSKFVGVSQQKLPKFFLKNPWCPMSVISIDTKLRHSKTAVYASRCDLVIEYTATESIITTGNPWL
jgi:phage anti-repressor protein